jgi:hypothetical protein
MFPKARHAHHTRASLGSQSGWRLMVLHMRKVRAPTDRETFRSKQVIAIEEIDRNESAGVRFGPVLSRGDDGPSPSFWQTH